MSENILNNYQEKVLFTSNEQITSAYPDFFETYTIDSSTIYIEKIQNQNTQNTRVFVLPSGIISISSQDKDFICGDYKNEEYTQLLKELNKHAKEISIKNEKDKPLLFEKKIIGSREYGITFFLPNDSFSSRNLVNIIDSKISNRKSIEKHLRDETTSY